jgi:hypothetical protein
MGKRRTGTILAYSHDANAGVVRGGDGRNYLFLNRHWRSAEMPVAGDAVVFYAMRRGRAVHIKRTEDKMSAREQKLV